MWTLSGFADEIDPDLNVQCDVLQQLGIGFLELRSAWDVNVLDPTDQQVDGVRRTLAKRGAGLVHRLPYREGQHRAAASTGSSPWSRTWPRHTTSEGSPGPTISSAPRRPSPNSSLPKASPIDDGRPEGGLA